MTAQDGVVYVIAEAGVNHNGNTALALDLVDAAAAAGADAVKFQAFRADSLAVAGAPLADYQAAGTGFSDQRAMLRSLELADDAFAALACRCAEKKIDFLCSVFDEISAQRIAPLVHSFKVPSGELTNHVLLQRVALIGKPMIVSTGMASLGEVQAALVAIRSVSAVPVVLLHCTSLYPAPPSSINLGAMSTLREACGVPVGYSDHASGNAIAFAAVALGAVVVEKHLTIDRRLPGPDHAASSTPSELAELVTGIRAIEQARGDGRKQPAEGELDVARVVRRSVVVSSDVLTGSPLTESMLATARPATGIPASELRSLIGRRVRRDITAGDVLRWEDLVTDQ